MQPRRPSYTSTLPPDSSDAYQLRLVVYLSSLALHTAHAFKNSLVAATSVCFGFMFFQNVVCLNDLLSFFMSKQVVEDFKKMYDSCAAHVLSFADNIDHDE